MTKVDHLPCPYCRGKGVISTSRGIGQAIKDRRESLGMKRSELSEISGVSYITVRRIEGGVTDTPTLKILSRLCSALQIEISEIVTAAENLPPPLPLT